MSEVMKQLSEEHRNIAKILHALEHQIATFNSTEQPDYDVLAAIADYFVSFPEQCHHPKEDLIYRKMSKVDPSLAETMKGLETEHEKISELACHFQEAVENVLRDAEVPRSAFVEVAHHFLSEQRRHIDMEEERFFPLALQILSPDDWAEIDKSVTSEEDPVFGANAAQTFAALRENLLKWEKEDEAMEH